MKDKGKPPLPPIIGNARKKKKSIVWSHFTRMEGGDPKKPRASYNCCGSTYTYDTKLSGTIATYNHNVRNILLKMWKITNQP